jgi:hypothetical protein
LKEKKQKQPEEIKVKAEGVAAQAINRHRDLIYRRAIDRLKAEQTLTKVEFEEVERRKLAEKLGGSIDQVIYDSMSAAAGALGMDKAQLSWAKRNGAPGFIASRVHIDLLKPWLVEREHELSTQGDDKTALECRKLRLQCERIEEDNDRERAGHLTVEAHNDIIAEMISSFQTAIYDLTPVLPPDLAGLTLPEIEKRLAAAFDSCFEKIKQG